MAETYATGTTCRPNFGAAGRRRRRNVAVAGGVLAVVLFAVLVVLDASWPLRALVALPAGAAFVSGLQVTRNTCVAHAATGRIEGEDLRTTPVAPEFAEASRRVARTIWRDALAGTALVAVAAALTGWI